MLLKIDGSGDIIKNPSAMAEVLRALKDKDEEQLIIYSDDGYHRYSKKEILLLKDIALNFPEEAYEDPVKYYLSLSKEKKKLFENNYFIKNIKTD